MNHFLALILPEPVQQYITANVVRQWREAMGEDFAPQWYSPEDYHITLKFLGDVPITEQSRLIAAVQPIAAQTLPFMLRLSSPGMFPQKTSRFPRIFWMGVAPNEALTQLAAQIDEVMAFEGFDRENRPYTPHITLVRRRRHDSGRSDSGVNINEHTFPIFRADSLVLMQTRSPQERQNGPNNRYNIVHTFPFGTPHLSPAS